jgi:hypothetical protein
MVGAMGGDETHFILTYRKGSSVEREAFAFMLQAIERVVDLVPDGSVSAFALLDKEGRYILRHDQLLVAAVERKTS